MNENEILTAIINDSGEELDCYITIKGQEIPCSREVYLAIKRPGRKENKRQQRNKRPFINGKRCQGDCSKCGSFDGVKCELAGDVSLDDLPEDGSATPVSSTNVEDESYVNITIRDMYKELEGEDDRCIKIFSLMLEELPQRDIAETLDIADGTVTYYIKKIRKELDKLNLLLPGSHNAQ